ncbi:MAG TPA: YdcH family protein [Polyangiaceae bacterium]
MDEYLNVLEAKHRQLDNDVARFARRAHLTPTEQREVADLKKEKLLTRDRIVTLRRSEPPR